MQPTEMGALQVRAALALGRHAEVLAAVGRTRRARRMLALEEAEALLGLMRPRDALRVATLALRTGAFQGDPATDLHLVRARALWQLGALGRASGEAGRASRQASQAETKAQASVTLARFAWKDQRLDDAGRLAREALVLYEGVGHHEGVVRALETEAGVLRDSGRFDEALLSHDRRVETAATTTRVDEMAQARADRGDLLAFLGRWEAAARELDAAIDLFRRLGDEREHTLARPRRAMVDLARGDLGAVGRAVERARACAFDAPRVRAEHHLLASDLHLAAGDADGAELDAREALQAFASVRCREGACRSRVRLALALVAHGRAEEGRKAAARALREAPAPRGDLRFLALLVLGRAELRLPSRCAAAAFESALKLGERRPGPTAAARLGLLLARGAGPGDDAVVRELNELEAWGDRRLLAYGLADVRRRSGVPEPALALEQASAERGASGVCRQAASLVSAAEALLSGEVWPSRFGAALGVMKRDLDFCRAAWIGPGAVELRPDGGVGPLATDDLAARVAVSVPGEARLNLSHGPLQGHPTRVLYDLAEAVVVKAPGGSWLYADFRDAAPAGALTRLAPLARLLAAAVDAGALPAAGEVEAFPELLGACEALRVVRQAIGRVGRSGLAIHVFGETGTGKEKAALAVHRVSARRGRLVCVNAAQLEDGLFESALFGHVKGAYTGAAADAEGYVAMAQGGTLFLDEITELSPRGQAKLLRFLETGEYARLGDPRPRQADVRIVSAANARMQDRVREQRFREDLMYRLADFTIALPPLRERGEDVLVLARHFLRLHAGAEGVSCPRLGADAARALQSHAWPGNVRELVKLMHLAVVLSGGGVVRSEHLHLQSGPDSGLRKTLRDARVAFERDMVARYLTAQGGCRSRTADALGITRQALALKLKQYGLT